MRPARPFLRRPARFMPALVLVPLLATVVVSGSLAHARGAQAAVVRRPSAHAVEPSAFVQADMVRLVTGDTVRVLTRAGRLKRVDDPAGFAARGWTGRAVAVRDR